MGDHALDGFGAVTAIWQVSSLLGRLDEETLVNCVIIVSFFGALAFVSLLFGSFLVEWLFGWKMLLAGV